MFNYIDYISNKNDLLLKMDEVKKHFNQLCEFDIDVSTAIKKIDATIEAAGKFTLPAKKLGEIISRLNGSKKYDR